MWDLFGGPDSDPEIKLVTCHLCSQTQSSTVSQLKYFEFISENKCEWIEFETTRAFKMPCI